MHQRSTNSVIKSRGNLVKLSPQPTEVNQIESLLWTLRLSHCLAVAAVSAGRTSAGGELDCVERRPLVSLTEWSGGQFENIILVVAAEGPGHEDCIPSTTPPGPARYMNITTNLGITAVSCLVPTVEVV